MSIRNLENLNGTLDIRCKSITVDSTESIAKGYCNADQLQEPAQPIGGPTFGSPVLLTLENDISDEIIVTPAGVVELSGEQTPKGRCKFDFTFSCSTTTPFTAVFVLSKSTDGGASYTDIRGARAKVGVEASAKQATISTMTDLNTPDDKVILRSYLSAGTGAETFILDDVMINVCSL